MVTRIVGSVLASLPPAALSAATEPGAVSDDLTPVPAEAARKQPTEELRARLRAWSAERKPAV